jgi:hypothetical protein
MIGDTAYGNVEVREELEKRSISVLAPVHSTSPKDGTIPKEAFAIDLETETVTCPQGKTAVGHAAIAGRRSNSGPLSRRPNPTLAGLASDPGGGVFVGNDPCRTKPPSSRERAAAMDGVVRSVATIYHRV